MLEQTLGHITHAQNLRALVAEETRLEAAVLPVQYAREGAAAMVPGFGNWTVRAGLRARTGIRHLRREGPLDGLFFHTQVPAVLLPDVVRRVPTVVSLDATPIQYDELGGHYGHEMGRPGIERIKWRLNRRAFLGARAVVTWAHWTKAGLVERYEVPSEHITVIPPGVVLDRWQPVDRRERTPDDPVRILFVGGDLARKGGHDLIEATRRLRHEGHEVQLDLVTRDDIAEEPGITSHHGLQPNTAPLIELYRRADIFCLPTLGDCLPMVLSEAGATGLPLVSTDVGAIREIVRPGRSGLLVPPGDVAALAAALSALITDRAQREALGRGAIEVVRRDFDATANAHRLFGLLADITRSAG